jgi:hypothetical protein
MCCGQALFFVDMIAIDALGYINKCKNSYTSNRWTVRFSNFSRIRYFCLLLFSGHRDSFPCVQRRGVKLTTDLHLVRRIRVSGARHSLPLCAFTSWTVWSWLCVRLWASDTGFVAERNECNLLSVNTCPVNITCGQRKTMNWLVS